ncbi:DUF1816 domain-containing protein [Gloeothece verrucosa]|uniref:CpcD-like domain-containing protein n=1 Tax=Gloeothece verrucosa (strain PCC 7822) TaxID=497965 RepID=E0UG28_GLOV7|nr:DUF1816 domain-containing protein [Gloeothece verrucosa]ADN15529.1 Domain of unknown function DUF1816 [Gloeothece verrucosa PCC 7822]
MDSLDRTSQNNSPSTQERVFIYEVVISSQPTNANRGSLYRRSRLSFRVTYSQMSPMIKRIARLGGKIVNITPIPLEVQNHQEECGTSSAPQSKLPWWVKISTAEPKCLYYFGPFDSANEAQASKPGYIEDLLEEGAKVIFVEIEQSSPSILTQEG